MLYLDYAKPLADGKYILSFFADSVADLESISHGQKFVTKNGTDYGVPQAGSTVIVTSPNSGKTTYVMDAEGIWVVTEDISYSAVVANPSDAATAKLEKLKVNDTTYANWTENEIKSIASESGGGKLYRHYVGLAVEEWSTSSNDPLNNVIGFTVTDTTATAHNRAYWISYFEKLAKYNIATLPEPYIFIYGNGSVDLSSIFSDTMNLNQPYIYSAGEGFTTPSDYGRKGYRIDNRIDTPQTYAEYVVEL